MFSGSLTSGEATIPIVGKTKREKIIGREASLEPLFFCFKSLFDPDPFLIPEGSGSCVFI